MYFRRKRISKMLSQREQNIIIQAMKPFKPTKIAFSGFDSDENKLELLYHFDNSLGYIGFMESREEFRSTIKSKNRSDFF